MRVLLLTETSAFEVMEIRDIGYTDNIFDYVEAFEGFNPEQHEKLSGLFMVDYDGDYFYMEGLTQDVCNNLCKEILINGYLDLTKFNIIYEYEEHYREIMQKAVPDLSQMNQF